MLIVVPSRASLVSARRELAYRLRRWRDHSVSALALLGLLVDTLRGRARLIWIGDSHSVYYNRDFSSANVLRVDEDTYVFHLGARLMHSLAASGFGDAVPRVLRWRRRLGRSPFSIAVVSGEIDIRCHLVPRLAAGADTRFVGEYVARVADLASDSGARPIVVVPPPPCRDQMEAFGYPVAGSFAERTAVFEAVRSALHAAAASTGVAVLDPTDALGDPDTGIRSDLTHDHCHTNLAGASIVRALVHDMAGLA